MGTLGARFRPKPWLSSSRLRARSCGLEATVCLETDRLGETPDEIETKSDDNGTTDESATDGNETAPVNSEVDAADAPSTVDNVPSSDDPATQ